MRKILLYILPLTINSLMAQNLPQKVDVNNQIIKHDGYILSYNEGCEQANWVYYVLKPSDLAGDSATRKNYFKYDKLIPTESASASDYSKTGYDRGHLKPAGDEPNNQTQMNETFYMSNISPQYAGFNRGVWKRLENYVRRRALLSDSVIVIIGGLLDDSLKTIGDNNVCVPKGFFKILHIFSDGEKKTECYLMSNMKLDYPISNYLVPLSMIEKKSKILF